MASFAHQQAAALGNTTLAAKLAATHTQLAATFNAAFLHNDTYDNGVMTTYTLPLHLGIVPVGSKSAVQKNLLDQVTTTNKGHNECGIIGMKFLFEQLAVRYTCKLFVAEMLLLAGRVSDRTRAFLT
jgi:hypothetical protein